MSSYIRQIQTTLANAGVYKGAIDGIAGKLTVEAVNAVAANELLDAEAKRAVQEQNKSNPLVPNDIPTKETPTAIESGFKMSERSERNLKGVHPNLVKVVRHALSISTVDFAVIEGVRSVARQAELVKKGASQTMKSRHITGHAVDIVPIVNGQVSWNFNDYYPLAQAMSQAANDLGIDVRWGGAWTNIRNKPGTPQMWVAAYRKRGGKFTDGPHFELPV